MRLISLREYAKINKIQRLSTVYDRVRRGVIPCVTILRPVKRIPWDDETKTVVKESQA